VKSSAFCFFVHVGGGERTGQIRRRKAMGRFRKARAMISTMHGGLCVHSEPFRTPGTITHHLLRREPRRVPRVFGVTAAARARSVRSHRHTARARVWFLGFCGASVKSPQQFIEPSLSTSSLGTCLRDPSFPPSRRHGRRAKYGTRHTRDTPPSRSLPTRISVSPGFRVSGCHAAPRPLFYSDSSCARHPSGTRTTHSTSVRVDAVPWPLVRPRSSP
jgi:hypothetical protein